MPKSATKSPKLYTFRAEVLDYPEDSWRDIQILSNQTFGELGAAVLAAFESQGGHMWNLETSDAYFEYNMDSETKAAYRAQGAIVGEPDDKTIGDLNFKVGEQLKLDYDYGTTWSFILTVTKLESAADAKSGKYPLVSDGHGPRMIEDVAPYELQELMEYQKKGETIKDHPDLEELLPEEELNWRYDDFSLAKLQKGFSDSYTRILENARWRPASGSSDDLLSDVFTQLMQRVEQRLASEVEASTRSAGKKKKSVRKSSASKQPKPKIFTFRFESAEYPSEFWREVEMTSEDTVGDLAAAVLAAFGADPDHIWNVYHNEVKYYHYHEDSDPYYGNKHVTPVQAYDATLGEIGLRVRSRLRMMYDYGTTWYFDMRVVASRPQTKDDKPQDYPRLVAGEGMQLLDDLPMDVNWEINEDLKNGRDLTDNEYVKGYVDMNDFYLSEFDLEQAARKFPKRVVQINAQYRP